MKIKQPDVLVTGAGPVGLVTALRLAREGLSVQVVDAAPLGATHSFALGLHPSTLTLFEQLGVIGEVLEIARPVRSVGVHDEKERRLTLDMTAAGGPYPFVAAIPQGELERILGAALVKCGGEVLWCNRLATFSQGPEGVDVQVDELGEHLTGYAAAHLEWTVERSRRMTVPFLVGADGYRSLVRVRSGIEFPEVGQAEHFAVFETEAPTNRGDDLLLCLAPVTTSASWPLAGGWQRWSFQLTDHEASRYSRSKDQMLVQAAQGAYPLLEPEHLAGLLAARAPWYDASKIGAIRWRIAVRFERRLATRFGDRRVQLVGDSAHLTGPAGMHSMNVGFLEADALAGALVRARRSGDFAPLGELAESRRSAWEYLLGLKGAPRVGPGGDAWLLGKELRLMTCLPASGSGLAAILAQAGIS